MKKKVLSLMLIAAMSVSLCACGGNAADDEFAPSAPAGTESAATPDATGDNTDAPEVAEIGNPVGGEDLEAYTAQSSAIYNANLGEFYEAYMKAFDASSVSERYALMGVAEAKLLEAGVMLPTTSRGGRYGITHVAPYSITTVMWGTDEYKFQTALVYNELIKVEDRDYLRDMWTNTASADEYLANAKAYMAEKGYTQSESYNYPYSGDPETWDVLGSSRTTVGEPLNQCVDGLMQYDVKNDLQPALAESYTVSEDGLKYTFTLRKGVKWVDSQGKEISEVTAMDFVNGFQHMMDTDSGLGDLEAGIIAGVSEYLEGSAGMDQVGVKALDDYTVEYTLCDPIAYFLTTLTYATFKPVCTPFFESKGGKFGADWDATCQYGQTKDDIAYCGAYVCTAATKEKEMVFQANEAYYKPESRNVNTVKFVYESGDDPTKIYEDCKSGVVSSCALTDATLEIAKSEGMFDNGNVFISATDATSYMAFVNLNRFATANVNDPTTAVTNRDAEDVLKTTKALRNVHVRRAITSALDRVKWNAQKNGDELAAKNLINSYTPGNFCKTEEEVTIDGLGTFPAGTYYGAFMQAQLDKDGIPLTVWKNDAPADEAGAGYDGWYNPEFAKAELAIAIEELAAQGIEVSAENPISVDLPYDSSSSVYTNCANAFKMSVESALEGKVVVNIVACTDQTEWLYTGYYTEKGFEANFDLFDLSGWGPDYGDPQTYLDTFLPDYAGYMIRNIGIF